MVGLVGQISHSSNGSVWGHPSELLNGLYYTLSLINRIQRYNLSQCKWRVHAHVHVQYMYNRDRKNETVSSDLK